MPNYRFIIIILCCFSLLQAQESQNPESVGHNISIYDKEVDFSGWPGPHENPANIDEVRIGLFFPDKLKDEFNSSIINAAELAVEEVNANGGYKGLPYRLIRRSSDGAWGAGSKEMIKLIYEDSVWAVIGSQSGTASHIAEQIVTKAFLPLISPISADPTLNYIRIPWIFRLPPDYQAQANLIVTAGIKSINRVGMISSTNHDGRTFANEVRESLKELNKSLIFHFEIPDSKFELTDILERAMAFQPEGLIIHLEAEQVFKLFSGIRNKDIKVPVFLPWIPDLNMALLLENNHENVYVTEPYDTLQNTLWKSFQQRYFKRFDSMPSAGAALTYDAVYLLVNAIEKAGLNRSAIRDAIADTDYSNPVIGTVIWDNTGGNLIQPVLKRISVENEEQVKKID